MVVKSEYIEHEYEYEYVQVYDHNFYEYEYKYFKNVLEYTSTQVPSTSAPGLKGIYGTV